MRLNIQQLIEDGVLPEDLNPDLYPEWFIDDENDGRWRL